MPRPEAAPVNEVRLTGVLREVRERWTPDGSRAAIASLVIPRPALGAARASHESEQPIPLRAAGTAAREIARYEGREVRITGRLRRRYYSRHGESRWGQVEVWVDDCRPEEQVNNQEERHG
jgi:single-stranded DNA-binding protein